ncbi:hypothetical protein DFJ74DRAFT_696455 [Hyaloraphidium curvatum]|nr:hypothetical protein DFJ74DRAFT_696455 [Hyaloraphidium curvatum]
MVATGVLFFTLGLPFAFALLVGGRAALEFLSYNAARGLEAESAWASLLLLLRPGTRAAQGPGSWDLAGPWAGLLAHLSAAVVGVLLLLLLLRMILFRRTSFPSQRAYRTSLLAVLLAGTLSKVLSPQYLVWLLPLLALAGAESLPTAAHLALFSLLGTAAALLTTWVFPYHFVAGGTGMPPWDGRRVLIRADGPEGEVDGWVALVMAARNAGLLGMVVWVGLPLLRR